MIVESEEIANRPTAEELLSSCQELVPVALEKARAVKGFTCRWKTIISELEQIPGRLLDLSSHPCFSKNALCTEELQAVRKTLRDTIELAECCIEGRYVGRLQMQSDLDAISAELELDLKDCACLVKTGVLGEATLPLMVKQEEEMESSQSNICELLARLQIGHLEAKNRALDGLLELIKKNENNVLSSLGRSNVSALVKLLTATSPKIEEKTVSVICSLAESGSYNKLLISEDVISPLIRLIESGSLVAKEKAMISLEMLSMEADTARAIVRHGGISPLIELCQNGDSVSQAAAAAALKNISALPETRQMLAEEGIIRVMINHLDCGLLPGSKEYAAECLQNLTASNDGIRRCVVSQGGLPSLLAYLGGPLPQESAVGALRNLVCTVSVDVLVSLGVLPRLVNVLKEGSLGAQEAAASAICRICTSREMKKLIGESGCIPLLVKMLEAKASGVREVATQAICFLLSVHHNCRLVRKDARGVPNLVLLLDSSPQNTAKKYAVSCLASLSSSRKCKRLMISFGAIGYLKKLSEMDAPGAERLLERLEQGKLRSLFSRH